MDIRRTSTAVVWSMVTMAVLGGGCGGDGRVKVGGTVTLNGVPIENGTINFRSFDGGRPTAGSWIKGGRYRVSLAPGKMRVEIQGYRQVGQEHAVANDLSSPIVPKLDPIVPARYNTQTTLEIDVKESQDNVDFLLLR